MSRLHCVLPPHMIENIVRNGSPEQREWALRTLATDTTLRFERHALAVAAHPTVSASGAPAHGPHRTIYDAGHSEQLPGRQVRGEGDPTVADTAVDEAYDGLGATYQLYWQAYHRDSIDDAGLPLLASVHYGKQYDNAFWNGTQMVFGDGDGTLFTGFTHSLDVIGHELTHGVTQDEAALRYANQSGALNESISDAFGSLVKQFKLGQTADQADWLIGAGLLAPGVHGVALRSLKAPGTAYDDPVLGKDPQPATMAGYVHTTTDNGGVHINSGIPNHAFYLVAVSLGGPAWERAGQIWYDALRDPKLRPSAQFHTFAAITLRAAQHRYGMGSMEAKAVQSGWSDVGIDV